MEREREKMNSQGQGWSQRMRRMRKSRKRKNGEDVMKKEKKEKQESYEKVSDEEEELNGNMPVDTRNPDF